MTLFSDVFGAICVINLCALAACVMPFQTICIIDLHQRRLDRDKKIYVGKWAFLFFTYSKEKDWYPKRTIIIELVTYILTIITMTWCIVSIFLRDDLSRQISLCLLMFNFISFGIIGKMAEPYRSSH